MNYRTVPLYWVNHLSALSRRELAQRFRVEGYNISPEEWALLLMLWDQDGQNPGEMSARTVRDPTTMTRLIDTMVTKGLVERVQDTNDRRRSKICLTTQGQSLQPALLGIALPMIKQALSGISQADLDTTVAVLAQIVENLSQTNQTEKE